MGKAYSEEQRVRVRGLLEAGRDEDSIEKETGVSDRTIRRWKLELERTGRIGKPPESRTGRHRVLNPEVEAAMFEHVKGKDLSVDDILWWLYDRYQIVVGTRTIRRVFERTGTKFRSGAPKGMPAPPDAHDAGDEDPGMDQHDHPTQQMQYQSPYAPLPPTEDQQLAHALQHHVPQPYNSLPEAEQVDSGEDEETIQLQLQQIALQRREVELKLKMKRLQREGKNGKKDSQSGSSPLFNPASASVAATPNKRDSRSKKKIEESKKRTAERQERMLRDLERRSRRRDHLTAEWVESKDIWPLRAQAVLAELMHQYNCYAYTVNNEQTFNQMYRDLYQLVDHSKGDWNPQHHDELLRERMKRKMGQLRTKMLKTGEIVVRGDTYGGWQRAEDYTGEAAGDAEGDETEIPIDPHAQMHQQAQAGAPPHQAVPSHEQYEPVIDPSHRHHQAPQQQAVMTQAAGMPYNPPMLQHPHAGVQPPYSMMGYALPPQSELNQAMMG